MYHGACRKLANAGNRDDMQLQCDNLFHYGKDPNMDRNTSTVNDIPEWHLDVSATDMVTGFGET
eukprot:XP_001709729.1 Hypothetical protein GL50803_112862 [Giardia lamblia ATCC 50803]